MNIPLLYNGLVYTVIAISDSYYFTDTGHVFKITVGGDTTLVQTPRWIITKGQAIRLDIRPDGLWYDRQGTCYGLYENGLFRQVDPRCGVPPFNRPSSDPATPWCAVHDAMWSIPAYYAFHTFEETNDFLRQGIAEKEPIKASIYNKLIEWFGRRIWDKKKPSIERKTP